jgi:hypothetical protein
VCGRGQDERCYDLRSRYTQPRVKKVILHVGGDKCGSSSIQTFLTKNPTPKSSAMPRVQYSSLMRNGVIGPKAIHAKARSSISGYVRSLDISKLRQMSSESKASVQRLFNKSEAVHILSCEGWLRSLSKPRNAQFLFKLINASKEQGIVDICAFVRPPVKWINSAWWQWGVWESNADFDQWLEGAIHCSSWSSFISKYLEYQNINSIVIKPVHGDVVAQFCEAFHLDYSRRTGTKSNVSLPREALSLMLSHRHHRPNQHAATIDFVLARALAMSDSVYDPAPFILSPYQVEQIIARTKESNLRLVEFMSELDRELMLNDASWWDSGSYSNLAAIDPYTIGCPSAEQALQMASDILDFATKSLTILRDNGLVDQLMMADHKKSRPRLAPSASH